MNLSPIHFAPASFDIVAIAYCIYYNNQYLTEATPNMLKPSPTFLSTVPEEKAHSETLQLEKLKMHMKYFQTIIPLNRKKTCEDFVREEMASEAAMWAQLRAHGGLRRELVLDSGIGGGRRF